jgi:hypothetical protein
MYDNLGSVFDHAPADNSFVDLGIYIGVSVMTVTATAKRRRRQARLVNGRKINRLEAKANWMNKNKAKR